MDGPLVDLLADLGTSDKYSDRSYQFERKSFVPTIYIWVQAVF